MVLDSQVATPTSGVIQRTSCLQSVKRDWGYVALIALALATRVPLIGNFEGEPDSSRYVTGVHLWIVGDRGNHLVYERQMSAGFYWFAAQLARLVGASVDNYSLMLNLVSLCASVLLVPLLFLLSQRVAGRSAAFLCAFLFLLSPAVWWMGIEPHPQIISLLFVMLSLYAYLRGVVDQTSTAWIAGSMLALTLALLVKIDAVLLFGAFFGVLLFFTSWDRITGALVWRTLGLLALSSLLFVLLRAVILRGSLVQLQAETDRAVSGYWILPSGLTAFKQAIPTLLALGPVLFVFLVIGLVLFFARMPISQSARWLILLVSCSIPGWIFWFLISGNNPRHVAVFGLPLIWIGVSGWMRAFSRRTAVIAAAAAVVLNFLAIPANSSPTMLMSPNVAASAVLLHKRQNEIRAVAKAATAASGAGCFLGTYTVPYFRLYALQASQALKPSVEENSFGSLVRSNRYLISCPGVVPGRTVPSCTPAYSVEFATDGTHVRFFGRELYSSPVWRYLLQAAGESAYQ